MPRREPGMAEEVTERVSRYILDGSDDVHGSAGEQIADYASPGTQCSAAVSVLTEHPVLCVLASERSHRGM